MSTTLDTPASAGPTLAAIQTQNDPLVQLLERMERHSNNVPEESRGMSEDIARLLEQARQPGATRDAEFRTQVAYLLQDWPKFSGSRMTIVLSPALQAELPPLARAYPGLKSTRMQALVAGTQDLGDRVLIGDIRAAAAEVAGLGGGHKQLGILVSEAAKVLEHRVVMATTRGVGPGVSADQPVALPAADSPETAVAAQAASNSADRATLPGLTGKGPENALSTPVGNGKASVEAKGLVQPPTAPPPTAAAGQPPSVSTTAATAPAKTNAVASAGGVLASRVSQLRQRMNEDKVKSATEVVLKAGTAAIDALEAFRTGPGREFSNKIDAAARHEPGGAADVVAQMTLDGRYSGLRREFDEKLRGDAAFAAAHDEVVKFGDRYFRKRQQAQETARDADIDYSAVNAQSQKADAEIGEATSRIPGREAGKSVLAELGNRAVELYNAAVQGLKALLGKDVGPESRPRPGPSPG